MTRIPYDSTTVEHRYPAHVRGLMVWLAEKTEHHVERVDEIMFFPENGEDSFLVDSSPEMIQHYTGARRWPRGKYLATRTFTGNGWKYAEEHRVELDLSMTVGIDKAEFFFDDESLAVMFRMMMNDIEEVWEEDHSAIRTIKAGSGPL